jgi:hypothetical protein
VVLKLDPRFIEVLKSRTGSFIRSTIAANPQIFEEARGQLICEGRPNKAPRYVDESYFYFTQHFTEGDMLDQADLYNHPWLLALRGQRDFATFVKVVRRQEELTIGNFIDGVFHPSKERIGWPLDHMLRAYKQVTPAFPGFYTVLNEAEGMTQFPLERKMTKVDVDPNFEVIDKAHRQDKK